MQRLTVHRLTPVPGLPNRCHALLRGDVDEVDRDLGVLRHPDHLAERHVLGDVAVHQVQVVTLVTPLPLQLLLHVVHHVVVLSVNRHDAAALRDLLEDGLKVTVGHAPSERREDLEAGLTGLDSLSDLPDCTRTHRASEDVVVRKVDIAVTVERLTPRFHLPHDRVWRHGVVRSDRQSPRKVEKRGNAPERRGSCCRLRRLREHLRPTGPLLRHRNADVRVRLDPARQHDQPRRIDHLRPLSRQHPRMRQPSDLPIRDGNIHLRHPLRSHNPSTSNDRIQHDDSSQVWLTARWYVRARTPSRIAM
ncbi:MAG: hypothetical protein J4G14_14910 [Dehalococcoidia bacterium]|nr:hypothetical protein [Dehalococcoidia bacterium]